MFVNYKTTLMGVGTLLGGVAIILKAVSSKTIDVDQIGAGITAISAGIGLMFAKDAPKAVAADKAQEPVAKS